MKGMGCVQFRGNRIQAGEGAKARDKWLLQLNVRETSVAPQRIEMERMQICCARSITNTSHASVSVRAILFHALNDQIMMAHSVMCGVMFLTVRWQQQRQPPNTSHGCNNQQNADRKHSLIDKPALFGYMCACV